MKIGLMSDTHSFLDAKIYEHFKDVDEIWHAGDIGTEGVADALEKFKPLRAVYGNIDNQAIRQRFPENLMWNTEGINVWMTHIGGYPGKYPARIKDVFKTNPPNLFICGHSHILKIMYDNKLQCLHMNPGAAGKHGWHKIRTIIRFVIDGKNIKDCEVIELE